MTTFESKLPSFERPPVVEVTLGVQFAPITALQAAHLGLFWQQIRDRFPYTETHPPLGRTEDVFGSQRTIGFKLEVIQAPPVPRAWYLSESRNELIQFQADRLVYNWRKIRDEDQYPRFPQMRDRFRRALADLEELLQREELGRLAVDQCEIAYINLLNAGPSWSTCADIADVLTIWNSMPQGVGLPQFESARVGLQFAIPGNDAVDPAGRLYIDIQPAVRVSDQQPSFAMNLVARGKPIGEGIGGAHEFLERGRECIVRAFAELTRPKMHKEWGRNDQPR